MRRVRYGEARAFVAERAPSLSHSYALVPPLSRVFSEQSSGDVGVASFPPITGDG